MENQPAKSSQKSRVLIIVLLLLLIVVAGMLYNEKSTSSDLMTEKTALSADLNEMKQQYDVLLKGKDSLNADLLVERNRIVGLLDSINLLSTDVKSLKRYKREARRLRAERKVLLARADSLMAANEQLKADLQVTGDSLMKQSQVNLALTSENTKLAEKVAKGATLSAESLVAAGVKSRFITGTERDTDRARNVEKLKACFNIAKNLIAEKGAKTIYVRFVDPAGNVIGAEGNNFTYKGSQLSFSASKEIYYENQPLAVCIYSSIATELPAGTYAAEVYTANALIGNSQFTLR